MPPIRVEPSLLNQNTRFGFCSKAPEDASGLAPLGHVGRRDIEGLNRRRSTRHDWRGMRRRCLQAIHGDDRRPRIAQFVGTPFRIPAPNASQHQPSSSIRTEEAEPETLRSQRDGEAESEQVLHSATSLICQ